MVQRWIGYLILTAVMLAATLSAGCGQRGPLYIPGKPGDPAYDRQNRSGTPTSPAPGGQPSSNTPTPAPAVTPTVPNDNRQKRDDA